MTVIVSASQIKFDKVPCPDNRFGNNWIYFEQFRSSGFTIQESMIEAISNVLSVVFEPQAYNKQINNADEIYLIT